MTTKEQLCTREAPCSAHEINRRVRQIGRDHVFSAVTPWSGWEANGAAWEHGAMVGENAQTNAVPIATVSQTKRIALAEGGIEIRREGRPVESAALRGRSRSMAERPIGAGLVTRERLPDGKEELNGAAPAQMNGRVAYNGGISPTMTTRYPKPNNGSANAQPAESRPAAGAFPGATGEAQLVTRRGRQKTPTPWLMAVLCRVGLHRGPWEYAAEGNCTQGRECGRCGSVHVRTRHQHEWRYTADHKCNQIQACWRCNDVADRRTEHHDWSASWLPERRWWQGVKQAHRCLRCEVVEEWTDSD